LDSSVEVNFDHFLSGVDEKVVFFVNNKAEILARSRAALGNEKTEAAHHQSLNSIYPELFEIIKSELIGAARHDTTITIGSKSFWVVTMPDELYWIECTDLTGSLAVQAEVSRLKEVLRRTEELASLGDLVAQMSHELNTPLGICVTSATHCQEEIYRLEESFKSSALSKSHMNDFFKSSKRASELITSNLNRASSIVAGLRSLASNTRRHDRERMRLSDQIATVVKQLTPLLDKQGVSVDLNNIPVDVLIYESPSAISQIFSNLIVNSIRHGFKIKKVFDPCIRIKAATADKKLFITFSDNGIGIPESIRSKIFDPFVSGARDGISSGLGLSIIREIVQDQLGGTIKLAHSERGACFEITMEYTQ